MKISIIGTGYVGLVTGVGLANSGHQVLCVDTDKEKVGRINKGECPIHEKDLDKLLKKVLQRKLFSVTTDLQLAVLNSEVTFVAVPTPRRKDDQINLSYIKTVSRQIGSALLLKNGYHTVVIKSTVVPETCSKVVLPLIEKNSRKKAGEFGLCMNPEFLREGEAVYDFMNPDRVIIGERDQRSGDSLIKVYRNFKVDILRTSLENAEMIKYVSNVLLSTLISFSNEIADICERIPGTDVVEILKGIYLDRRLNPIINNKRINPAILTYLFPGCGFGGSCLPKDIAALISFSIARKYNPRLLSAVAEINKSRPSHFVSLAEKELGTLKGKKIAVLGFTFKPGTSDTRESPAIAVIKILLAKKAKVWVYDPLLSPKKNFKEVVRGKDACLLVTKWEEFKKITPNLLKKEMSYPLLIDGRDFLDHNIFAGKIKYLRLGHGK